MRKEKARRRDETNLAGQYSEIGIRAVAASVRYQDAGKSPRKIPAVSSDKETKDQEDGSK
jgi:hypothetical protein